MEDTAVKIITNLWASEKENSPFVVSVGRIETILKESRKADKAELEKIYAKIGFADISVIRKEVKQLIDSLN